MAQVTYILNQLFLLLPQDLFEYLVKNMKGIVI